MEAVHQCRPHLFPTGLHHPPHAGGVIRVVASAPTPVSPVCCRLPMGPTWGSLGKGQDQAGEASLLQICPSPTALESQISRRFAGKAVSGGRLAQVRVKQLPNLIANHRVFTHDSYPLRRTKKELYIRIW
jgi:hypothetical protein